MQLDVAGAHTHVTHARLLSHHLPPSPCEPKKQRLHTCTYSVCKGP